MSGAWQTVGTIASTAGVTTFAIGGVKGIVAGYRTYASPHTCLMESERRLKRVRSRLQGLSPKRREEIESASLEFLEGELEDLTDMHCRLSKRMEESTFTERHFPYSEFRGQLSMLEEFAKDLLNDTLKTTVPCVDNIVFKPENSRRARPSSSESTSNPENLTRAMERPSSSKSTFNLENSTRTTERSSSSEPAYNPENSTRATERPSSSEPTCNPENSTRATERPSSSGPTFNPEISTRTTERPSSSESTFNPENLRWAMKGSSSSETFESFSDFGDIPLARMV